MDVYASGDACYNGGDSCNGLSDYQLPGFDETDDYYEVADG